MSHVPMIQAFTASNQKHQGWTVAVFDRVKSLQRDSFQLADVYGFESELASLFPDNNNVRAKIRQQLQVLRDQGIVRFDGRGEYSVLSAHSTTPDVNADPIVDDVEVEVQYTLSGDITGSCGSGSG